MKWTGEVDGHLELIDQTCLPGDLVIRDCRTVADVEQAICTLVVRGAPAIGIAAAYGVCLGLQAVELPSRAALFAQLDQVISQLAATRPTAVNLTWALERLRQAALALPSASDPQAIRQHLLAEARAIHDEDRRMCHAIGAYGAPLLAGLDGVLTHCNAGGLATAEFGTALAVIFATQRTQPKLRVFVDETRPLLQGSRLTAWELRQQGVDTTVICDSAAAHVMQAGLVQAVVTGADRIAANGDAANKIGTYGLAVAAAAHDIPFYIAAPSSTFDRSLSTGDQIPIEERAAAEVVGGWGRPTAPKDVAVYNPAFDVTPARLIRAIICEQGVIQPVTTAAIEQMFDCFEDI